LASVGLGWPVGSTASAATPSVVDTDGDGIFDDVDALPLEYSTMASDIALGGATAVTITDAGSLLLLIGAAADTTLGLHVTAHPRGNPASGAIGIPNPATLDGCGYSTTILADADFFLKCGSITATVVVGPIQLVLPNGGGIVSVPTGSTAKVDVLASGSPTVQAIAGSASFVSPLGTVIVVKAGTSIATDTQQYVCRGRIATILGTDGPDKIKGTNGRDVIVALGGDDKIDGGGGDDIICAGDGNDKIEAGDGDDYVDAGDGNDTVEGGAGNDNLLGGAGNDKIEGGGGNDTIDGGSGSDKCQTGGTTIRPALNCEER